MTIPREHLEELHAVLGPGAGSVTGPERREELRLTLAQHAAVAVTAYSKAPARDGWHVGGACRRMHYFRAGSRVSLCRRDRWPAVPAVAAALERGACSLCERQEGVPPPPE